MGTQAAPPPAADHRPAARTRREYGVYVIQLRDSYGPRDHARLPALYVGSSWHSPQERFRQHRDGARTRSRKAHPHVWRLRPELYADIPRVSDRESAELFERRRALRLAQAGFTVRSDGEIPRVPAGALRPFDRTELAEVEDLFDRAVFAIAVRGLRPLSADDVARLLLWRRGQPVDQLVRTPNPDLGRFAHVEPAAVRERIGVILSRGWLGSTVAIRLAGTAPESSAGTAARTADSRVDISSTM